MPKTTNAPAIGRKWKEKCDKSLQEIGYNAFFDTPKLKTINYAGTKEDWTRVKRGSNWLTNAGTTVVNTIEGPITVDPKN